MKRYTVYELKEAETVETFLTYELALKCIETLVNKGTFKEDELDIEERNYIPLKDGDRLFCDGCHLIYNQKNKTFSFDGAYGSFSFNGEDVVFDEETPHIEIVKV